MITIKIPEKLYLSSVKKAERRAMYKYLSTELPKAGSKLVPVPLEVMQEVEKDYKKIYKISNMDKVPFGRKLLELSPDTQFFASRMYGHMGINRIRKYAAIKFDDGDSYIIYQRSIDFSNILDVLDTKNNERYITKSLNQVQDLFKILRAPMKELPLLVNSSIVKNKQLKKLLYSRLGCEY